jgi:hypothetical protein
MTMVRRRWLAFLFDWAVRAKRDRPDAEEVRRRMEAMSFETDTRKLNVRWTVQLRDRMRRRWLKLKR